MTRPNRIWCTRRSPFRRSVEVNFIPDYRILHDAGYNVLAYDLRNFGLSGAANGGIASSGIFESRDVVPLSGARRRADRTERCADDVRQHPDRRQAASLDPRNHRTLGWLPRISATARTCARVGSRHTWPEENDVSVPTRAVSAHDPTDGARRSGGPSIAGRQSRVPIACSPLAYRSPLTMTSSCALHSRSPVAAWPPLVRLQEK